MSKLKEKAALSVGQTQAANVSSSVFTQIDNFSHFYDRGNHLVNGKPSFTVDQAADLQTETVRAEVDDRQLLVVVAGVVVADQLQHGNAVGATRGQISTTSPTPTATRRSAP